MKIISFNRFLLANFAHAESFGSDIESFFKRFRILSNIYANLALLFITGCYNIISTMFAPTSNAHFLPLVCIPLVGISLLLLRTKYYTGSSIVLMLTTFTGNFITTYTMNSPIAALCSIILLPHFVFYSTSSVVVQLVNLFACLGLSIYNTLEVKKVFEVTLSDEQAVQINHLILSFFLTLMTTCLFCVFQKSIEEKCQTICRSQFQKG